MGRLLIIVGSSITPQALTCLLLQIFIRVDEQCKVLCRIDSLTDKRNKAFKVKVEDEYRVLM